MNRHCVLDGSDPINEVPPGTVRMIGALQELARYEILTPELFESIVTSIEQTSTSSAHFQNFPIKFLWQYRILRNHLPQELAPFYTEILYCYDEIMCQFIYNAFSHRNDTAFSDYLRSSLEEHIEKKFNQGLKLVLKFQSTFQPERPGAVGFGRHEAGLNNILAKDFEAWYRTETRYELKRDMWIIYVAFINYLLISNLCRTTFPLMPIIISWLSENSLRQLDKLVFDRYWSWGFQFRSVHPQMESRSSVAFFWAYIQRGHWSPIYQRSHGSLTGDIEDEPFCQLVVEVADEKSKFLCPKNLTKLCELYLKSGTFKPRLLIRLAYNLCRNCRKNLIVDDTITTGSSETFVSEVMGFTGAWFFQEKIFQCAFTYDDKAIFEALITIPLTLRRNFERNEHRLGVHRRNDSSAKAELTKWKDFIDYMGPMLEILKEYRTDQCFSTAEYSNFERAKLEKCFEDLLRHLFKKDHAKHLSSWLGEKKQLNVPFPTTAEWLQ